MCKDMHSAAATLISCFGRGDTAVTARTRPREIDRCNCNGPVFPSPLANRSAAGVLNYVQRHSWAAALFDEDGIADQPYFGPQAVQVVVVRNPIDRRVPPPLQPLLPISARAPLTPGLGCCQPPPCVLDVELNSPYRSLALKQRPRRRPPDPPCSPVPQVPVAHAAPPHALWHGRAAHPRGHQRGGAAHA